MMLDEVASKRFRLFRRFEYHCKECGLQMRFQAFSTTQSAVCKTIIRISRKDFVGFWISPSASGTCLNRKKAEFKSIRAEEEVSSIESQGTFWPSHLFKKCVFSIVLRFFASKSGQKAAGSSRSRKGSDALTPSEKSFFLTSACSSIRVENLQ